MNGSMNEVKHTGIPGGVSKRNVIIQKDEFGFGLTVSGDNPVYVQSVKDGSAAAKAGVKVGDEIMKVNGSLVTQSNHIEVVTLIKSGSYVALTLLGKDNTSKSPTENRVSRLSGGHIRSKSLTTVNIQNVVPNSNQPLQGLQQQPFQLQQPALRGPNDVIKNDRINDVERTLNQEREYNKTILEKYRRAPSPKTQKKLAESKTRISALENQLQVLSGIFPVKQNPQSAVISPYRPPIAQPVETRESVHPPFERAVLVEEHNTVQHTNLVSSSTPNLGHNNMNELKRSRIESTDIYDATRHTPIEPVPEEKLEETALPPPPEQLLDNSMFVVAKRDTTGTEYNTDYIFSMEDDEFSSDEDECLNNHGPFERLELLKDKKAHLAVFLHYLISNSDPVPLFFWVVADIYSKESKAENVKEWKKWGYEIYSTFVAPSAPLKVDIGGEIEEKNIAEALNDPRTTDDRLRDIFSVARLRLEFDLESMLNDFRMKRSIGLGGLFGDRQLEDNMDHAAELRIVETTLMPHLDTLLGECESSNDIQNDKNIATTSAIATLMKSAGLGKFGGKGTSLERCRSFAEKEKTSLINWRGKRAKVHTHMGHQFISTQYSCVTLCNICNGLLWGIGTQGLQCQDCKFNVHRKSCMESIKDTCNAKKRRPKTVEIFPKEFVSRPAEKEDKHTESGSLDPSEKKSRGSSLNDDKPATRSDNDLDEPAPDSGKESDSRSGTPFEEQPQTNTATTPTQKSKSLGYRQRKKEMKSGSKVKIAGKSLENGTSAPSPSRLDSPTPVSSDDDTDSDFKVETEVAAWSQVADKKIIKKLKTKEIKRQEVIHELLHTEKTHVRNLKILDRIFHRKIRRSGTLTEDEIKSIFPNLEELIAIHETLLKAMKARVNESENEVIESIGDIMLDRFDGEAGEDVKQGCATFCRNQSTAMEEFKNHLEKNKEFAALMTKLEENPYCRRLTFAAILSSTHQRLVKYPMLLESLNKATPVLHPDYKNVEKCSKCCKDILNHVNDEIKQVEDDLRLKYLATKIEDRRNNREETIKADGEDDDTEKVIGGEGERKRKEKDSRKFNILNHSLVLEGDLIWKVKADRRIDLHVILLNDTLVLLTKQDDKFILKTHNTDTQGHSPLIPLSSALIREVATDKKAFFLVSTSMKTPQIYELISQTYIQKKLWVEKIERANERNKGRIVAARGRRDGLHLPDTTSPTPTIAPSPIIGDEEEKTTEATTTTTTISGKEKDNSPDNSEAVMSDEEDKPQSYSTLSSPLPEEETTDKYTRPPLSKEKIEELNDELNGNHSDMMKLITKRSAILSELQGEKYSETLLTNINQPRDVVVRAMAHVEQLNQVFCQCSVADDQRENYFTVHHQLQTIFGQLLDAVTSENRHDSYTDMYDGKESSGPNSKRTSSKVDSVDMTDSSTMPSPSDETTLTPTSSPPPILVSDTTSINELCESPRKSEEVSSVLGINDFFSPEKIDSLPHNDVPPKQGESGLLVTSPFKIQKLRKRTSDPSNDSLTKLHATQQAHHARAASFNVNRQPSQSSDSE